MKRNLPNASFFLHEVVLTATEASSTRVTVILFQNIGIIAKMHTSASFGQPA
jgi:hypothetical protein